MNKKYNQRIWIIKKIIVRLKNQNSFQYGNVMIMNDYSFLVIVCHVLI